MSSTSGPAIPTAGLFLCLDASSPKSVSTEIEVLVVAGGGGGGRHSGGGGGGGGVIHNKNYSVSHGTSYTVSIGGGGACQYGTYPAASGTTGWNGGNSVFGTLTAIGGGGGGYHSSAGVIGGSGGGSSRNLGPGAAGTAGQGFAGGTSYTTGSVGEPNYPAAGGGGAGGVGGTSNDYYGGVGGPGILNDISGTPIYYAGGGGGNIQYGPYPGGAGGIGGGGAGAPGMDNGSFYGYDGLQNTGGGGGGCHYNAPATGTVGRESRGGSGIVIVRYPGAQKATGGTITSAAGYTVHTFYSSDSFTMLSNCTDTVNNNTHNLGTSGMITTQNGARCFDCSANSKYIYRAVSMNAYTNTHTMIAWGKLLADIDTAQWRTLWRTLPDDHPILVQNDSNAIGYYDNNTGGGFVQYGSLNAGTLGLENTWAMYSIVGNGSSTTLYINNGIVNASVPYNTVGNTADMIGAAGVSQPFGFIGQCLLYDRSLSITEISQIFNATRGRYGV